MRALGILALGALLCGAGNVFDGAHDAVRHHLTDPMSASFRDEASGRDGAICGEVNARNRDGGYDGFAPYIITTHGVQISHGTPDWHAGMGQDIGSSKGRAQFAALAQACQFQVAWVDHCAMHTPDGWADYRQRCLAVANLYARFNAQHPQ